MNLTELKYNLPKNLIAQTPATPRDHAKLLVINRKTQELKDYHFYDLPKLLKKGDVLVFNESKVFPARVFATKETGGKVELLLLSKTAENTWEAMRRGKVSFGQTLALGKIKLEVIEVKENLIKVKFSCRENDLFNYLNKHGFTPLPPYIKPENLSLDESKIRDSYQTIYAKVRGSAAAPTAGLHFTKSLISKLKRMGIKMEYITLHVGLGTFAPVKEDRLEDHKIHSEYYSIGPDTAKRLNNYKSQGKRIIAVGTTTTRVLETASGNDGLLGPSSGQTRLFIYPPYRFKFVEAMITNFHLPGSTLLALIFAFAGEKLIKKAYKHAIAKKYRFFSFGDASLII